MGAAQAVDPVHVERMRRLESANRIRSKKAAIRRAVAVGTTDAAELLVDPPDYIEKVKVIDFLTWLPKIGKTRGRRILRSASGLPETTELRRLSPATRERLATLIRGRE